MPQFQSLDFQLNLELNDSAPKRLQDVGIRYWALSGLDPRSSEPVWVQATNRIDFRFWSGSAHYAAAAGVTAVLAEAECVKCGGVLTLTSRQALLDALFTMSGVCRECESTVDVQAARVLDPEFRARREARRLEADAKRVAETQAEQQQTEIESQRRAAIFDAYPVDEAEPDAVAAGVSFQTRLFALAILHRAEIDDGLVRLDGDAVLFPANDEADPLRAVVHSGLLRVHPGASKLDAFLWDPASPEQLEGRYYLYEATYYVAGVGLVRDRVSRLAATLRDSLAADVENGGAADEILAVVRQLIADEGTRHLRDQLTSLHLGDPVDVHGERTRTLMLQASSHFALGHIYRMSWTAARDAVYVSERNQRMPKASAISHALNRFEQRMQTWLDDPKSLGEPFRELHLTLPLAEATRLVFRVLLEQDPMSATVEDVGRAVSSRSVSGIADFGGESDGISASKALQLANGLDQLVMQDEGIGDELMRAMADYFRFVGARDSGEGVDDPEPKWRQLLALLPATSPSEASTSG